MVVAWWALKEIRSCTCHGTLLISLSTSITHPWLHKNHQDVRARVKNLINKNQSITTYLIMFKQISKILLHQIGTLFDGIYREIKFRIPHGSV